MFSLASASTLQSFKAFKGEIAFGALHKYFISSLIHLRGFVWFWFAERSLVGMFLIFPNTCWALHLHSTHAWVWLWMWIMRQAYNVSECEKSLQTSVRRQAHTKKPFPREKWSFNMVLIHQTCLPIDSQECKKQTFGEEATANKIYWHCWSNT